MDETTAPSDVRVKFLHAYTHSQFKDIQFAYEVLSDPQRRERYDHFGMSAVKEDGAGAGPSMGKY